MLDGSVDVPATRGSGQVERRSLICKTIGAGGNPLAELTAVDLPDEKLPLKERALTYRLVPKVIRHGRVEPLSPPVVS